MWAWITSRWVDVIEASKSIEREEQDEYRKVEFLPYSGDVEHDFEFCTLANAWLLQYEYLSR
jgi:hypothetical protein